MIRRTVIALLCCVTTLIVATAELSAQEGRKTFASQGTVEVGGSISFSSTWGVSGGTVENDPVITFTAEPYVGYFVIDGLEVGANPLGVTVLSSGNTTVTALDLYGSVAYNFKTPSKIFPYLEGLAGYTMVTVTNSTSSNGGFSWGGRGGIKVALTPGALLNLGAEYRQVDLSPSGASGRYGYNRLAAVAGFSIWF